MSQLRNANHDVIGEMIQSVDQKTEDNAVVNDQTIRRQTAAKLHRNGQRLRRIIEDGTRNVTDAKPPNGRKRPAVMRPPNGKISKTPTGESRQDSRKVVDGPTTVRFAAMIGPDGKTKKTPAEEMKPDVNRHVPNKLTNSVARRIWSESETQGLPSKGVAKKLRDR